CFRTCAAASGGASERRGQHQLRLRPRRSARADMDGARALARRRHGVGAHARGNHARDLPESFSGADQTVKRMAGKYTDTLKQPGFSAFFWTQFLGAFNDNFYKMVVSLVALNVAAGGGFYVDLIALLFILPSALFSGYGGHLADVSSKRSVLVAVKIF